MMLKKKTLILLALALTLAPAHAEAPSAVISGRVTDAANKPIGGIPVTLYDQSMHELASAESKDNGEFALAHRDCEACNLLVSPQQNTGLASAMIDRLPGKGTRNLIVQLQHGFLISGKIVSGGKGLKGMALKVVAKSEEVDAKHRLHHGGTAKTGWGGTYSMVLTPGPKKLLVINEKRKDLVSHCEYDFDVTADAQLPDVEVPQAGSEKDK